MDKNQYNKLERKPLLRATQHESSSACQRVRFLCSAASNLSCLVNVLGGDNEELGEGPLLSAGGMLPYKSTLTLFACSSSDGGDQTGGLNWF